MSATRGAYLMNLGLDPAAGVAVGIYFDHDEVRVALADLSSTVLAEDAQRRSTSTTPRPTRSTSPSAWSRRTRSARRAWTLERSSAPASASRADRPPDGRVGSARDPARLGRAAGAARARPAARLHVEVDNDANLGALAEASFGAGRGLADIVYVMLGLRASAPGSCSAAGSTAARPGWRARSATSGAARTAPSAAAATAAAWRRSPADAALAALLRPRHGRDVDPARPARARRGGRSWATRLVNDAGRAIGRVLADLCNALNPEAIIVGGELSRVGAAPARDPRIGRPPCAAGGRARGSRSFLASWATAPRYSAPSPS